MSMQAQMMGLYPESTVNMLTEWQQGNAVPPIENADFSKWQEELGASALPYNINTFPINQTGLDQDWLLSLNMENCSRWKQEYGPQYETLVKKADLHFKSAWPAYYKNMVAKKANFYEYCDYLQWAYYTGVQLEN